LLSSLDAVREPTGEIGLEVDLGSHWSVACPAKHDQPVLRLLSIRQRSAKLQLGIAIRLIGESAGDLALRG
jgi:hypothetical protein